MSSKCARIGARALKQQATSADRQERKLGAKRALEEMYSGEREAFAEVDAVLRRVLGRAQVVTEVGSRLAPGDNASAEELEDLYDVMLKEAQMVPETLFHWPDQGVYMMVFDVDGQTWVYRAKDLADWGPESLTASAGWVRCDMSSQDDPL